MSRTSGGRVINLAEREGRRHLAEATERLTETANPREVAKIAAAMTVEALTCRRLRHKWDPSTVDYSRGRYTELIVCARCGSTKGFVYNRFGSVVETVNIDYAEGYLLPKGTGRLDSAGRGAMILAGLRATVDAPQVGRRGSR